MQQSHLIAIKYLILLMLNKRKLETHCFAPNQQPKTPTQAPKLE